MELLESVLLETGNNIFLFLDTDLTDQVLELLSDQQNERLEGENCNYYIYYPSTEIDFNRFKDSYVHFSIYITLPFYNHDDSDEIKEYKLNAHGDGDFFISHDAFIM